MIGRTKEIAVGSRTVAIQVEKKAREKHLPRTDGTNSPRALGESSAPYEYNSCELLESALMDCTELVGQTRPISQEARKKLY